MPVADLSLPNRLLAGGGPGSPDPRVLRALTAPLIGQFDPDFTAIMDDVMRLARRAFLTDNRRCFPVSGLASAGLEAVLNTLTNAGDDVAIGGGPRFVAETTAIARRYGAHVVDIEDRAARLVVVPRIDPTLGVLCQPPASDAVVVVDATLALGASELRIDAWDIDVCVAGVDYGVGAPSGMALVTYSSRVEGLMQQRSTPPPTSYLDLLQLQEYWSAARLNHHTAPTSLVYGLREALELIDTEGLPARWARHTSTGAALREGLVALGLDVTGEGPYAIVRLAEILDEAAVRARLREQFGVYVKLIDPSTWRIGLLGADAQPDAVNRLLASLEKCL